jgi:phosphopantothenoylcysteine synthetase/decarboxylase
MKVIVTTGPSFEPIDEVRRLTNFSTGELGVLLANRLADHGCQVFCLKGVGATYPGPLQGPIALPFSTNDDLQSHLLQLSKSQSIQALFHVAALCDFKVRRIEDASGQTQSSAKLDSRASALSIHLEPATKIISTLRSLFPKATLVGWKYELAGTPQDALAKAWRQLKENHTDACVLNGKAYGPGFAFCTPPADVHDLKEKADLVEYLASWLLKKKVAVIPPTPS